MAERHHADELLDFPCHHEFKAFAAADHGEEFAETVRLAVGRVVPVGRDLMHIRKSSGGRYQCVTVCVRLESSAQLTSIYAELRRVAGLRYLL